jgi:hypothetical protein
MNQTAVGEKGSDVYTFDGVNDPRVALSVQLVRGQTSDIIKDGLINILSNNSKEMEQDAFLLAFMTRNIRGGKGERDIARVMFNVLYNYRPELMLYLIDLIPYYGYWEDLFKIWDESGNFAVQNQIKKIVISQLQEDIKNMKENKLISLLAKWIPRHKRDKHISKILSIELISDEECKSSYSYRMKLYNKLVTKLNSYLNTIEIKQCAHDWKSIDPAKVPGRALAKYRKAFFNQKLNEVNIVRFPNDPDRIDCANRFKEYMERAIKNEVKVKGADVVTPDEIYHRVCMTFDDSEENKNVQRAQWISIREKIKECGQFNKTLAMMDLSGSMAGKPVEVSIALGVLLSQLSPGFIKSALSFDSTPQWLTLPQTDDIYEIFKYVNECGLGVGLSTDFQKAMELILMKYKTDRTPIDLAYDDIVVFTDMAWDAACGSNEISCYSGNSYRHHVKTNEWQTHIEMIRECFKRAGEDMFGEGNGYKPPRIVIWNLRPGCNDFHAQADTPGVIMFSGWSPSLFKYIMKNGFKVQTPYDGLRVQLDDELYDPVRDKIKKFYEINNLD